MYKKITYPGLQRAASKNQKENSKDKIKQKGLQRTKKWLSDPSLYNSTFTNRFSVVELIPTSTRINHN